MKVKKTLWYGAILLSVAGLLLTGYLTWAHVTGSIADICRPGSGCSTVLTSEYAQFLGLPTALYGLVFYLTALLLFLSYPLVRVPARGLVLNVLLALHLAAFLTSILLTIYSFVELETTCPYCLVSVGLITLLFAGLIFWYIRGSRLGEIDLGTTQFWQASTAVLGVLSLLLVASTVYGFMSANPDRSGSTETHVLAYDQLSVGRAGAPIRVVEFFDLECPHCQRFTLEIFPRIRENYIETGQVLWTFRHSPIPSIHDRALYAHSVLSLVPPNHFLEAKKRIMRDAPRWVTRSGGDHRGYFKSLLEKYGVKDSAVTPELRTHMRQRRQTFAAMGVRGTPFFLVNGKAFGSLEYGDWKQKFDALLEQQTQRR